MILYKYYCFNSYNVDSVSSNKFWLSEPSAFNDPFDAQLRLSTEHDEKFLATVADYIFKHNKLGENYFDANTLKYLWGTSTGDDDNFESYTVPDLSTTFYSALDQFEINSNDFVKFLLDRHSEIEIRTFLSTYWGLGIVCFGTEGDNPSMWAHYTNNHKGFCVKYTLDPTLLNSGFTIRNVNYQDLPPSREYVYAAFKRDMILDQLSTKSRMWDKESECRIISLTGGGNRLVDLPLKPTAICFGLRMPLLEQNMIRDLFEVRKVNIEFCNASMHRDTMKIRWASLHSNNYLEQADAKELR